MIFLFRERSPDNEEGTLPSAPTQYQHVDTSHVPLRRAAIAIAEVRKQNHDQGLSLPLHFSDQNNGKYIFLRLILCEASNPPYQYPSSGTVGPSYTRS